MIYSLVDFGSTFTKLSLVDGAGHLLATAQHPTTSSTDVLEGYEGALASAAKAVGSEFTGVGRIVACSSAAGGLSLAAVGLVDSLTAAAARRAALSAGARVDGVWSGRLDRDDQDAIRELAPDVILFSGGTDGGQRQLVIDNARIVAGTQCDADVVVACNTDVAEAVRLEFERAGHYAIVAPNVLPAVDRECLEPVREAIRTLFIDRVVRAKGISTAAKFFDAVVMPTPAAVLSCAELLAENGPGGRAVLIIDVGGATTDVHSVIPTQMRRARTRRSAPPPSRSARTVEGDLGVRWNADSAVAADPEGFDGKVDPQVLSRAVAARRSQPSFVPADASERHIDAMLTLSCIQLGLARHVGRLITQYVVGQGAEVVLSGRDLREADVVLVTGGSVVRTSGGSDLVEAAINSLDPTHPVPRHAPVVIDSSYILAAVGLLSTVDGSAALNLLQEQLPTLFEARSAADSMQSSHSAI